MRLHHLTLTAFGPFPGTERVDFDSLNGAGLFLLSGATGAGKTSILDAVCFALYGTVPGVRGVKVLKSQHADDKVRPEVVLDFSVRDRRFVVRRSPEWSRPKLRGSGTRTEKASASLSEVTPDGERLVSHRAAEVGLTISDLVGMQASQFQQVAMLPQGEFQRFLQATSTERHDVLQQLFRTARFARIEDWVQEHSRRLREESAAGEQAVQRLLATIEDRAGDAPPEASTERTGAGAVVAWAGAQSARAARELEDAVAAHAAADRHVGACRDELQRRRRTAELVRRRDQAHARLSTLAEKADAAAEQQQRLAADTAAAGCLPVLTVLDRATREVSAATAERHRQLELLRRSIAGDATADVDATVADREQLTALERDTRAALTRAEGALPALRALEADRAALAEAEAELVRVEAERERLARAAVTLPERQREVQDRLTALCALASGREALRLRLQACRERAEAAASLAVTRSRLVRQQDALRDARDVAADARDRVQTLTQRRLDGYAAELAGALQPGERCQVCGSTEHPDPTVASADRVGADEQQRAQLALDEATAGVEAATAAVNRLAQELTDLRRRADGRGEHDAVAEREAVSVELAEAERAEAALPALEQELEQLTSELDRHRITSTDLDLERARLGETVASRRRAVADAWTAVADAVPGMREPGDLTHHVEILTARLTAVEALRNAEDRRESAASHLAALEADADGAATAAGFQGVAEVRSAVLTERERAGLRQLLDERREAVAAAEAVLTDPEVSDVEDLPSPDVAGAEHALLAAEEELRRRARQMHQLEQRAAVLRDQADRLRQTLAEWAPALEEAERAAAMSKLVRGMGADNQLQMRLSAYVLATRLDQVLAAANERLSHMRDQRYVLQRTDRARRKGSQAGLGLELLDQWTGDTRDPATLSGGETFVVSLALALGLADVVTQEAGGTEIETLFVDEGFGALDADTLDDVMDRLDALRAGGRSVGVVSHVTELRTRIPTQVHVHKTPTGSSIRVG